MTVIEATSGTYRSRVDGTLVLQVEIEPRHAPAALALFGMPGQRLALAALKDGSGAVSDKPEAHSVGPLAKWLVMRCKEPQFWEWLGSSGTPNPATEEGAAEMVKEFLGIQSRKEIDGNDVLEDRVHRNIRIPYSKWLANHE